MGLFSKKIVSDKKPSAKSASVADVRHSYELKIKELEKDQELALKGKDFELKHFKDETVKSLNADLVETQKENAVLESENKMLDRIVDLNKDILDVKKLVGRLIDKLPTIDLKSLTVNNGSNK